jgi:N utilization substance protein A
VNELQGEKIDIIPWSPEPANFVVNALAPAEVSKVVMDEDNGKLEVVVPDDMLSLAIGRRGQNVRLASQLTGWDIDILPESEESERRQKETRDRVDAFVASLDVDEVIAHLLVAEGFTSIEEVAYVDIGELTSIEGFDDGLAQELQRRGVEFIEKRDSEFEEKRKELGVADEVRDIEGLTPAMLVSLGEAGIKTRDDLADLSGDELVDPKDGFLRAFDLDLDTANAIIMKARAHWFADEGGQDGGGQDGGEQDAAAK